MVQLVYASQARSPFSADALRALLVKARANNTSLSITGCLLHVDGAFLQILEGDSVRVQTLFAHIGRDPRHHRVNTLLVRQIDVAQFADWSMGFIDGSGRASSIDGYRATNGFGDLAGDPTRVRQIIDGFRDGRWRVLAA